MQETRRSIGIWVLCLGISLIFIIVAAVLWIQYKLYYFGTGIGIFVCGVFFGLLGFGLARRNLHAGTLAKCQRTEAQGDLQSKQFYLNGCFFQPYEQDTSGERKQFRLLSEPPLKPEKEAAIIRYLINEGLTQKWWPQISKRIEEESNWAFFA
jgi:hypothetical protein